MKIAKLVGGRGPLILVAALTVGACALNTGELAEEEVFQRSQNSLEGEYSVDWTGKDYVRSRTVHLRVVTGADCSGTLLLPNAVLTARKCVTVDGLLDGSLANASEIRVRMLGMAPLAGGQEICDGPDRIDACSVGLSIYSSSNISKDFVLLKLKHPLSHASLPLPFTPLATEQNEADYVGTDKLTTGWSGGCSARPPWEEPLVTTQHWTKVEIGEVDGNVAIDRWINNSMMFFEPGDFGGVILAGDTGGPTWSDSQPHALIGMHSIVHCPPTGYPSLGVGGMPTVPEGVHQPPWWDGSPLGAGWDTSILHQFSQLRTWLGEISAQSTARDLSALSQVDTLSPGWTISGGQLKQTGNGARRLALLSDAVFHGAVDHDFDVMLQGPDNDSGGVVLNFFDEDNYLVCEANEQSSRIRLWARHGGQHIVIAESAWDGDFASPVSVSVSTRVDSLPTPQLYHQIHYYCEVSGGGTQLARVAGEFAPLGAGRAGVYNHYNKNLSAWDFQVKKKTRFWWGTPR